MARRDPIDQREQRDQLGERGLGEPRTGQLREQLAHEVAGTCVRRAPESADFANAPAAESPSGSATVVEYAFENATAQVQADVDGQPPPGDGSWITIATFLPDGTCRETTALVATKEEDRPDMYLRVRGLIGASSVVPGTGANGGAK